jgi:hypothetical protein
MADNARGIHVSPGIYSREIDINYAVRSLGITTLGVVGETVKGPAFQAMDIANWREYQEVFGGTSTEKFKGSQYPKYELPYIAKSYLSESEQLKVVRVLGLSGYNAGPAWIITASSGASSGNQEGNVAVAVIRSRGTYKPYQSGATTNCVCENTKYDTLSYFVGEKTTSETDCRKHGYNMKALKIEAYTPIKGGGSECIDYDFSADTTSWGISQYNHGRFKLVGITGPQSADTAPTTGAAGYFEYAVSLNPLDKEYILNVLGSKPYDGDAPIYVESLYDVALEQGIVDGTLNYISSGLTTFDALYTADFCHHESVNGIMTIPNTTLKRKNIGERYVADKDAVDDGFNVVSYNYKTGKPYMVGNRPSSLTISNGEAPS